MVRPSFLVDVPNQNRILKNPPYFFFQRLQEIDDNLLKVVRGSSGRNPAGVEAEIRELEKELKIPGIALSSSKSDTYIC